MRNVVKADGVSEEICLFTDKPAKVFLTSFQHPSLNLASKKHNKLVNKDIDRISFKKKMWLRLNNQDLLIKTHQEVTDYIQTHNFCLFVYLHFTKLVMPFLSFWLM